MHSSKCLKGIPQFYKKKSNQIREENCPRKEIARKIMAGIVKWWRNFKQYKQFTGTRNITIKKRILSTKINLNSSLE